MCKIEERAAVPKVSSHWILKTTDFKHHYCFSIVWGFGLGSCDSCYMTRSKNTRREIEIKSCLGYTAGSSFINCRPRSVAFLGNDRPRKSSIVVDIRRLQQPTRRQRNRERRLQNEFALFQTSSLLFRLVQFVKCWLFLLELNF